MSEEDLSGILSPGELAAVRGAAVWYAKYHARIVAAQADDTGAYATAEREEYLELISAIAKLGVRISPPEAVVRALSPAS